MELVSTSHLVAHAGGDLSQIPDSASQLSDLSDLSCTWCGTPLDNPLFNGYAVPYKYSPGFNNHLDCAAPGSGYLCIHCGHLGRRKYTLNAMRAYVTPNGIFPLNSDLDLQQFFLSPPEPPFVVVRSSRQQAHLYWRTPLSLSKEIFHMRFDDLLGLVRRPAVISTVKAAYELDSILRSLVEFSSEKIVVVKDGKDDPGRTLLFAGNYTSTRDLANDRLGMLSPAVQRLIGGVDADDSDTVKQLCSTAVFSVSRLQDSLLRLNTLELWWVNLLYRKGLTIDSKYTPTPIFTPKGD